MVHFMTLIMFSRRFLTDHESGAEGNLKQEDKRKTQGFQGNNKSLIHFSIKSKYNKHFSALDLVL